MLTRRNLRGSVILVLGRLELGDEKWRMDVGKGKRRMHAECGHIREQEGAG